MATFPSLLDDGFKNSAYQVLKRLFLLVLVVPETRRLQASWKSVALGLRGEDVAVSPVMFGTFITGFALLLRSSVLRTMV